MIKVIVDTGIVVSAAFRDKTPEEVILFIVGEEDFEWIISPTILEEYNEVLARKKFGLPPEILQNGARCSGNLQSHLKPISKLISRETKKTQSFWN